MDPISKPSQVLDQLEKQACLANELTELVAKFDERLIAVQSPPPPADATKEACEELVPLANKIRDSNMIVQNAIRNLGGIFDRLQL